MEDKVCWADESGEPEFRDDQTGRPLHPVKVLAAREEELKELERWVYVEADVEDFVRVKEASPLAYNGWTWIRASESTVAGQWRRTRPNSRI